MIFVVADKEHVMPTLHIARDEQTLLSVAATDDDDDDDDSLTDSEHEVSAAFIAVNRRK